MIWTGKKFHSDFDELRATYRLKLHVRPVCKTSSLTRPPSTDGFLSNHPVNCIHIVSQASNSPSLVCQNEKPVGSGLKTTNPNTWLSISSFPPLLSLSLSPLSQPVIHRSVVQATALATVLPRAQCCRVRMKVPGGGDANHPLHLSGEPNGNPGHKPAPGFFSQRWCNCSLSY